MNLTYSLAKVLSDDGFQLSLKRTLTKPTNKYVFNSISTEFRKGFSEDIFIEINKYHFPANKYYIVNLDIK